MLPDGLWGRVEWIGKHVAAAMPPASAVAQAFARLNDEVGDDGDEPTLATLNAALAAFDALPAAEQRRVMNGWTAKRNGPSVEQVMEPETGANVYRYRSLVSGCEVAIPVWDAQASFPDAVRVLICEGTTQAEAAAFLRRALAVVLTQWDEVTGDDEWGFKMKNGSPETPTTPMPASYAGGLKLAPTAA